MSEQILKNKDKLKKEFKEVLKKVGIYWKNTEELKEDLKKLIDEYESSSFNDLTHSTQILKEYEIKEIPHHNKLNKLIILFSTIEKVILEDEGKKFNDNDIVQAIGNFVFKDINKKENQNV